MHIFLNGKIMRQVPQGVNTRTHKREKKNEVYIKNSSLESKILFKGRGGGSLSKQCKIAIIF